jgi:DNA-binding NtrC family response regulator
VRWAAPRREPTSRTVKPKQAGSLSRKAAPDNSISVVVPLAPPLSRSVEQLTELVGRVPLKGIVRETSDIIERLCIEAALELTQDNRASAAEMLGLSRQSLYVKLRRYGLGDLVDTEGDF